MEKLPGDGSAAGKLIFSINVTIDGFADHTFGIVDDEMLDFHTNLLSTVDIVLFGRKTYELLGSYWPVIHEFPETTEGELRFAEKINALPKIVFSKTLNDATWNNTKLVKGNAAEEIMYLKQKQGKNMSIGGISLSTELLKQGLIDECWFLVHPVISGKGRRLLEGLNERKNLKLLDVSTLKSGVVVLHYLYEKL